MGDPEGQNTKKRVTVFVSYSHKDRDLLGFLVAQLKALEKAGLLDCWVDTRIDAGEKWYPEIEAAMKSAAVAVCLVSEHFLSSDFCTKEEIPFLLKRASEDGLLIIPVLLSDCPWYAHRWVEERQMLPGEGQSVRTHFPTNPAAVFSRVAKRIYDKLSDPNYQPPKTHLVWPMLAADRIDLTRLPETGAALFGRDEELKLLDQTWSSCEKLGEAQTRVLAFVAYGGVGKSTLVNHWLKDMQKDHFRGATRVFGWSFYSQGAREEGMASADTFIDAALRFFGDPDPTSGSPWDKGERLARLAGAERALLVLDGMEPLQSGHTFDKGKLRDPTLESLLRGLARGPGALCLTTTREPLPDLTGRLGFASCDLEQISPQAGRALLRSARVVGTDAELEDLAERFGPHALAVSLLGVYLHGKDPHGGIDPAKELEQMPGKAPIDRVLAGFEQWLADTAELEVLRMLGLFDRPADAGCLGALRAKPPILGLTDRAVKLRKADWGRVLGRLERLQLIHVRHKDSGRPVVDAHPLLREHFAQQLREKDPDAWRAAHRRLYEHLCETTKEGDQPTLADLQPLYQAVVHGCQAGLQQDACDDVYWNRLRRGKEAYSTNKLGALGSDLGAIACFFETPWNRVSPALTEADQAWLLNEAAYCLRALGRLTEALEPMRAGMEMEASVEHWTNAAIGASNLSELELTLGEVAAALGDAEQSMVYADRSGSAFQRMANRAGLGDSLHQTGRRPEAQTRFREAEQMQAERQPEYPLLYSLQGFLYCDLLLAEPERAAWRRFLNPKSEIHNPKLIDSCRVVSQRAAQTLKWVTGQNWLLDIALDHLTLGRAAAYQAIIAGDEIRNHVTPHYDPGPQSEIGEAVSGLRCASTTHHLPRALLTRAWLRFLEGGSAGAQVDLEEAREIAERGSMRLHMADIHLYRARLFHGVTPYPWDKDEQGQRRGPKDDLVAARKLIEQCGYWRRKEELEDAEEAAKNWQAGRHVPWLAISERGHEGRHYSQRCRNPAGHKSSGWVALIHSSTWCRRAWAVSTISLASLSDTVPMRSYPVKFRFLRKASKYRSVLTDTPIVNARDWSIR
jgi:tetratricopeptide (TPR) repeat protein